MSGQVSPGVPGGARTGRPAARPAGARSAPGPAEGALEEYLAQLWELGGTDLLLLEGSAPLGRVDGELAPLPGRATLPPGAVDGLVTGVLSEPLTGQFRTRGQVDFAFSWRGCARLRGNAYLQRGTTALALRLIPYAIPSMDSLGLPEAVHAWVRAPRGLALVTGPTGSGKSTTLAAVLDAVNATRPVHILTLEDPIEYHHAHQRAAVSQREVGTDTASFADGLRAALREDPDVVMLGEMRDPESIAAALTIAETGHLVLATLHTNDTAQALDRIVDVFPSEQQPQVRLQLAHTLLGVLNQVLVPRIGGGRVAAFEVLVGTAAVRNLIREGKTRQLRNQVATGHRDGMRTLETSLSDLVARGVITVQDAVLCSSHPEEVGPPRG